MKSRVLNLSLLGGRFQSSGVPGEAPTVIPEPYEYVEVSSPSATYNYGILYTIDYYDLSGYNIRKDTIYPKGYNVQDVGVHQGGATYTPNIERAELLLTKVPREDDLTAIGEFDWYLPGSLNSRYGLEEVLAGLYTRMTVNTNVNQLMVTGASAWGTGDATAGEKMFIVSAYKFLLNSNTIDFTIPHSSRVVPVMIDKEDKLPYNMRLRRSYELQQ